MRLKEKQDIKIFILYLLMHIDRPVDFVTLHDLVVQDEFVNQFDFIESFYELCETGAVKKFDLDGKEHFTITPEGQSAAETLQSDLLRTIRTRALRSARCLLEGKINRCGITQLKNGKFRVDFECRDKEGPFLQLALTVDSERQAERMKLNFEDRADFIHRGVLSLLSGDMNYLSDDWSDGDPQ